jgi:hypothetical protein
MCDQLRALAAPLLLLRNSHATPSGNLHPYPSTTVLFAHILRASIYRLIVPLYRPHPVSAPIRLLPLTSRSAHA